MADYSLDEFVQSCGVREPLRLRVTSTEDPSVAYVKILHHPFAIVGRHFRADLPLDHDAVSRRHAYLQVIHGRVFCVDLESRTGVRWPDKPAPAGWLDPGVPVAIGPFRLELLRGERAAGAGLPVLPAPGGPRDPFLVERRPSPAFALEFVNRTGGPVPLPVDRCLSLVGKSPSCKPRFTDESASRFQCSLLRTPDGLWVVDLLGRGGVQVNRALVRFARLAHGDELRMARYIFRVHEDPPLPGRDEVEAPAPIAQLVGAAPAATDGRLSPGAAPVLGPAAASAFVGPWTSLQPPPGAQPAADAQLLPLVQQFGQMQQHMFEQFQQAMMMMFQMFGSLHREQLASVQQELEEIRRLSHQLVALQGEHAERPPAGAPGAARGGPDAGVGPAGAQQVPREEDRAAAPAAQANGAGAHASPRPVRDDDAQHTDDDIHALLCQRIAEIQNERQTRWQRIMSLVAGN